MKYYYIIYYHEPYDGYNIYSSDVCIDEWDDFTEIKLIYCKTNPSAKRMVHSFKEIKRGFGIGGYDTSELTLISEDDVFLYMI